MLLGTLGASLFGNILAVKGAITMSYRQGMNRAEEGAIATRQGRGIVRAGYENKKGQKNNKMNF